MDTDVEAGRFLNDLPEGTCAKPGSSTWMGAHSTPIVERGDASGTTFRTLPLLRPVEGSTFGPWLYYDGADDEMLLAVIEEPRKLREIG